VLKHFQDDASAKTFNRPAFKQAIEFIKKNKNLVNYFLIQKWDRFSRNISEAYKMLDHFMDKGIECNAIDQWLNIRIPENKLLLAVYLATPEIENDRRSLNTRAGMRRAMKEGRWLATAPTGYSFARDGINKPILVINEDAALIREAFELYSTGLYFKEEVRLMVVKKGLKIKKAQFLNTLRNPVYCGKILIKAFLDEPAMTVKGLHEPIISDSLFFKCQQVAAMKNKNPIQQNSRSDRFPLRGHLLCNECGKYLTGSRSKGNGGRYEYYHCQHCFKQRFRTDTAHESLEYYLESLRLKKETATLHRKMIKQLFHEQDSLRAQELRTLSESISNLKEKIMKTDDMYISGSLELESYQRMKDHYQSELLEMQSRMEEMKTLSSDYEEYLKFSVSLLTNISGFYKRADVNVKQQLLSSIFPGNLVFENGSLRTNRINEVVSLLCSNEAAFGRSETKPAGIKTGQSNWALPPGLEPGTL